MPESFHSIIDKSSKANLWAFDPPGMKFTFNSRAVEPKALRQQPLENQEVRKGI
jgi:hypothetical protein